MKIIEVTTNRYSLYQGDCLEVMDKLIEQGIKVDAIITDPPYGTTACKWDSVIPFNKYIEVENNRGKKQIMYEDEYLLQQLKITDKSYKYILDEFNEQAKDGMWERLNKLIKENGVIILFGSEPFSSALRMSNIKNYKYDWIWEKEQGVNFLMAKKQPLKVHEDVCVFSKRQTVYNPQMSEGKPYISGKGDSGEVTGRVKKIQTKNKGTRYPRSIIQFKRETGLHPTQKPVALLEYLIKTYTNENETVLDFAMGSGSTGVACINTKRKFIGIELDETYFNIAKDRIENT